MVSSESPNSRLISLATIRRSRRRRARIWSLRSLVSIACPCLYFLDSARNCTLHAINLTETRNAFGDGSDQDRKSRAAVGRLVCAEEDHLQLAPPRRQLAAPEPRDL